MIGQHRVSDRPVTTLYCHHTYTVLTAEGKGGEGSEGGGEGWAKKRETGREGGKRGGEEIRGDREGGGWM